MRRLTFVLLLLAATPAAADYRITRDFGGHVEQYKAKYEQLRDKGERIVIDGICNSACTLFFGIIPLNRVCVTPRASIGFHEAYIDKRWTFGVRVASASGTADLLTYYPPPVKDWIRKKGGLTPEMKKLKNGVELWEVLNPCPEEF